MPYINVSTNVKSSAVDTAVVKQTLSKTISDLYSVPELFVMVAAEFDKDIQFATTTEPTAIFHVRMIGKINPEYNAKAYAALTKDAEKLLGIPAGRVFIVIEDVPMNNWGFNGAAVQL